MRREAEPGILEEFHIRAMQRCFPFSETTGWVCNIHPSMTGTIEVA